MCKLSKRPSTTWITQIGGVLRHGHAFLWSATCIFHNARNYNLKEKHAFLMCECAFLDVEALKILY